MPDARRRMPKLTVIIVDGGIDVVRFQINCQQKWKILIRISEIILFFFKYRELASRKFQKGKTQATKRQSKKLGFAYGESNFQFVFGIIPKIWSLN